LIEEQNKKDEDQAKRDAETWGTQTHDLIAAAYGDGEAALARKKVRYEIGSMAA
jgi:hypothetical protein